MSNNISDISIAKKMYEFSDSLSSMTAYFYIVKHSFHFNVTGSISCMNTKRTNCLFQCSSKEDLGVAFLHLIEEDCHQGEALLVSAAGQEFISPTKHWDD